MSKNAWQNLGLVLLTATTMVGVVWLLASWPPAPPPSNVAQVKFRPEVTAPTPAPAEPLAVFLGDSYTQGVGADDPANGFACRTADAMGWECGINGQSGTGYVNDGSEYSGYEPGFAPYTTRVNDVLTERPDVVVVSGGRNDLDGWEVPQIADAASTVIGSLDSRLPDAELVVVAPFWTDGNPPAELLDLRDELRSIARREDAIFVDPLGQQWMTNRNSDDLIAADGIHPNEAGHDYLAERLADALRKAGVTQRPARG